VDHISSNRDVRHHERMTEIRRAALHDLPGAYRVCLQTGDAGMDATSLFRDPDLLGSVYVGPYVVGENELALVIVDDGGVAGYCLAARDTRAFAAWAERDWWPALRTAFPRRPPGTLDAEIVALYHDPPIAPPDLVNDYPAHLHIDLLERVRGGGWGRRLIERQLDQLVAAGVEACHLTVAPANTNAIAFYRHLGWTVLREADGEMFMGVRLGGKR
jgi:ribosomal protein S18 acetylase RimI-like enzyme